MNQKTGSSLLVVIWLDRIPIRSDWQVKRTRGHYCGPWSATSFFVFAIGDVHPPCFMNTVTSETPEAAFGPVRIHGTTLEFETNSGNLVMVTR
jgi:hypothetical protein